MYECRRTAVKSVVRKGLQVRDEGWVGYGRGSELPLTTISVQKWGGVTTAGERKRRGKPQKEEEAREATKRRRKGRGKQKGEASSSVRVGKC